MWGASRRPPLRAARVPAYRHGMSAFIPCPRCNRHVKSTESSCVFCGAARVVQAGAALSVVSLAALALAACDPKPEAPTTPSVEVPSASASPSGSAPVVTPEPSSSAPPVASVPPLQPGTGTPQEPPVRPAMRYGIAPNKKP
jgi:hypothetical protein